MTGRDKSSCSRITSASRSRPRSRKRCRPGTISTAFTPPRRAARSRRPPRCRSSIGSDLEHTLRTLAVAASQSAGLRENFGTMTKPFHAGRAAESGVLAADLVRGRLHGDGSHLRITPRLLSRPTAEATRSKRFTARLGNPWTFLDPGYLHQTASFRLSHPSRHDQDGRAHRGARHRVPTRSSASKSARTTTCRTRSSTTNRRPSSRQSSRWSSAWRSLLLERRGGLERVRRTRS